MASFFQSSLASPNIDPASKFVHFQKPPIFAHTLVQEWWHVAVLMLGAGAVLVGGLVQIFFGLRGRHGWAKKIIHLPLWLFEIAQKAFNAGRGRGEIQQPSTTGSKRRSGAPNHEDASSILSNVGSFCITTSAQCDYPGCGLHIRSGCSEDFLTYMLDGQARRQSRLDFTASAPACRPEIASKVSTLGSLDMRCLKHVSKPQSGLPDVASSLSAWCIRRGYDGLVIRCGKHDDSDTVEGLLLELRHYDIPILLHASTDSHLWETLNFEFVDGILLENACVLPSGERRDFFRASNVRACAAQCKHQRKNRPDFFFGFIELWKTSPSAAALKRTYKLADFFGAKVLAMASENARDNGEPLTETPLSGFDWLKKPDVVWLQRAWSSHTEFSFTEEPGRTPFQMDLSCMLDALPAVDRMLSLQTVDIDIDRPKETSDLLSEAPPPITSLPLRVDIWHFASCGAKLCSTGCFSLRDEIVQSQYDAVLAMQKSLKHNLLLRLYGEAEKLRLRDSLAVLSGRSSYPGHMQALLKGLTEQRIRIFAGLDSGFTLPDEGGHLWAVSDTTQDQAGSILDIHISLKVPSDVATIWHTFLAYKGVPRLQRYEEELLLSQKPKNKREKQLPLSIIRELEECSESELLYLVEQIRVSGCKHPFNRAIVETAEQYLVQDVTFSAWNAFNSRACLDESVGIQSLLEQRIKHFKQLGATMLPTVENLVILHKMLQNRLETALRTCDRAMLDMLTNPLLVSYGHAGSEHALLPSVDLYGLIFFCALRRLAFEDVYLETTDRCPLFLLQPDQAGVFAELWVLGSQCQIYFGVSPRTLGEIAYNRYQVFLGHNPPPEDAWTGKEVLTAYSIPQIPDRISTKRSELQSEKISCKVNTQKASKREHLSQYRKGATAAGALSIFCFPAIIDVVLLTFLGRGLYLTAFMSDELKVMADYAIMTALIMTGGVTGLVGSTGGFYMFNSAFDNLAHFMVQRFSASMMLTSLIAVCGLVAFGFNYSWFGGLIFVLYLFPLSIFLTILGILATMHRQDSFLSSGRVEMWKFVPILFVSPVLTIFVPHWDLPIYLSVIYTFTFAIITSFRRLCHEWTSWHLRIPSVTEKDMVQWFQKRFPDHLETDDAALMVAARVALKDEVSKIDNQEPFWNLWNRDTEVDEFAGSVARNLRVIEYLLATHSGCLEVPELFSSAWFVQCELALNNKRQMVRGLKEHSTFIHYRYSRYDIGQNVGLFLLALLDRLIAAVMSARLPPVYEFTTNSTRYAIGFALLHFLCGAVAMDVVLQRHWGFLPSSSKQKLRDLNEVSQVTESNERQHRKRYGYALAQLTSLLLIIFGVCTILQCLLVSDYSASILFLSYVSSYTAVLLCQFHRCFTKSHRLHVITVLSCCSLGFTIGCILRAIPSTASFQYDFVIGQNIAAISAVIGTGVLTRRVFKFSGQAHSTSTRGTGDSSLVRPIIATGSVYVSSSHIGDHRANCADIHKKHCQFLEDACFGVQVDTTWQMLEEDVRRFLFNRVSGISAVMTPAVHGWLSTKNSEAPQQDCTPQHGQHQHHIEELMHPSAFSDAFSSQRENSMKFELTCECFREGTPQRRPLTKTIMQGIDDIVKWISVISGAAQDVPRELWYVLNGSKLNALALWILLKLWKLCWWSRNFHIYTLLLAGKNPAASLLDLANHGERRILRRNLIMVDSPKGTLTGFIARSHSNLLGVLVHQGLLNAIPQSQYPVAVAFYDAKSRLYRRQEFYSNLETLYHYDDKSSSRWPISKTTIHREKTLETRYDAFGRPISGQQLRNGTVFDYEFHYKHRSVGDSDLVCATYKSSDDTFPALLTVYWCVRPNAKSDRMDQWIPSNKVQVVQAVFFSGQTYEVRWIYKHAHGADIEASVYHDGVRRPCFPPPEITEEKFGLLEKPKQFCFDDDDLLIYHSSKSLKKLVPFNDGLFAKVSDALVSSWPLRYMRLGEVVSYHRLSSSALRTALWDSWQRAPYLDALTASFVDEFILRQEPLLREYWRLRDSGSLRRAAETLDQDLEQIVSAIEPTYESSSKCPLIIKPADLFIMGLGKDANQMTSRLNYAYSDSESATSVIFSDIGCWPDSPGGVSNCRRDLVDGHKTIKGHCLAESANDYGIPRYQIERNMASMKILPLWGLDGKTAHHGILDNLLQTQVDQKICQTEVSRDVEGVFVPLLRDFVRGARSKRYNRNDLVTFSNIFLKMNRFFETRDYNKTWHSEQVRKAWVQAWLVEYDDPNVWNFREHPAIVHPSLNNFQEALNLYIAYFFIYSVNMPPQCPTVFQTTNHGIGSLYGMLLKYRRGVTWGLWDHAIFWRETCLNISPAQCLLPLPVQLMLLAGSKLSCHLAYTHVDIILPCTSVFNPDWEKDLGTDQGLRGSRKIFSRKIDPIVNGIGNMDLFEPITEIRSKFPTAIMLSNVQFIKDIKTAVLAADVIVNKYGFGDYRLVVYGAQDRQPTYVLETVQLINTRGLASNVTLAGFGSPTEVLKDAWIFLNSSLSEGLPLAIGEAALAGVPIVATEVGATSLVLTDPDDMTKRYGEVVPPNDPESLARAQLSILAMMGPWAEYTRSIEPAPLPYAFTAEDVARITKRMYEKGEDRKILGLKLREVVLRNFHGHRYLREHEQMFWIQRRRAEIRRSIFKAESHPPSHAVYGQRRSFNFDNKTEESGPAKMQWQQFRGSNLKELRKHRSDVEQGTQVVARN